MGAFDENSAWAPEWVSQLGVPVWVSGPDGKICYINSRAESLLGVRASEAMGQPCHSVVGGLDLDGRVFCGPSCAVSCLAKDRGEIDHR